MKNLLMVVSIMAGSVNAFGQSGTTNDLPNPILKCVETVNGAVVADGRKELTVGKDQFGQLSLEVVQKDQFSGNQVLATFLSVTSASQKNSGTDVDVRRPTISYFANENDTHITLKIWKKSPTTSVGIAMLRLPGELQDSRIEFACKTR